MGSPLGPTVSNAFLCHYEKEWKDNCLIHFKPMIYMRHCVVGITTAQLHSTNPELRLGAGLNPARGVSGIRDGEDL